MRKLLLIAGILVVGGLLIAYSLANRPRTRSDTPVTVRVGFVPVTTALPLFVAEKKGLFAREGISVEKVRLETANMAVEAIVADRIDATSVVADLPWLTIAQRDPSRFKLYAWSVLDADIPMDMILVGSKSTIKRLVDLKGKTLATFPGSQLKAFAAAMLARQGIDPKSLRIIELPPSSQIPALAAGSADALFCLQPICTIAQETIGARTLVSSPIGRLLGDGKPIAAASFGLSTKFIREHPQESRKFVRAMWQAIDLINADQAAYRSIYPSFAPVPAKMAARIPVTKFMTSRDFSPGVVERELAALRAAGLITGQLRIDSLVYKDDAK